MADTIYEPGEVIFKTGDESLFAYVIKKGEVEILDGFPEKPTRLALLETGAVFGEMGLVDERPRLLTARAVSETRTHEINKEGFVELIRSDPDQALRYLKMFFERLRETNARLAHARASVGQAESHAPNFVVTLIPKTEQAATVLGSEGLRVTNYPFRVGRTAGGHADPLNVNDLSLPDSSPFNVSRNHFSIEREEDGVYVHDRGSYLGTIVNSMIIGGRKKEASMKLNEGENTLSVGSRHSPYQFVVNLEREG